MSKFTNLVQLNNKKLIYKDGAEWFSLPLDSEEWFNWLALGQSVSVKYRPDIFKRDQYNGLVYFTVRPEKRKRNTQHYWTAWKSAGNNGTIKKYIGSTTKVTYQTLVDVAEYMRQQITITQDNLTLPKQEQETNDLAELIAELRKSVPAEMK